jgi:hypothetical protein
VDRHLHRDSGPKLRLDVEVGSLGDLLAELIVRESWMVDDRSDWAVTMVVVGHDCMVDSVVVWGRCWDMELVS